MVEKKEESSGEPNEDFEQTDIFINRSKNGKGLNIKAEDGSVLTVSIESVKKVIDGVIQGTRFSRFKPSVKSEAANI